MYTRRKEFVILRRRCVYTTKVVRDVHLTTFPHTDKHQVGPSVAIKRSKTLSNQLDSGEEKETMNITTATFTFGRQRAI